MATLTFFGYTGFLLGPVLVGQVSQVAGLRSAIGLLGVLALVLAAAGWLVLRIRRAGTFTQGEELLRTSRG
jgi:membrane protein DedA with SNARE-associated domain